MASFFSAHSAFLVFVIAAALFCVGFAVDDNTITYVTPRVQVSQDTTLQITGAVTGDRLFFTSQSSCALATTTEFGMIFDIQTDGEVQIQTNTFGSTTTYRLCLAPSGSTSMGQFFTQTKTISVFTNPQATRISSASSRVQKAAAVDLLVTGASIGQYIAFVTEDQNDCSSIQPDKAFPVILDEKITIDSDTLTTPGTFKYCLGELGADAAEYTVQTAVSLLVLDSPSGLQISAVNPRIQISSAATLTLTGAVAGQLVSFVDSTATNCDDTSIAAANLILTNDQLVITSTTFPTANGKYLVCVGEYGAKPAEFSLQGDEVAITSFDSPLATQLTKTTRRFQFGVALTLTLTGALKTQRIAFVPNASPDCATDVITTIDITTADVLELTPTSFITDSLDMKVCLGEFAAPAANFTMLENVLISAAPVPVASFVTVFSPRAQVGSAPTLKGDVAAGQFACLVPAASNCPATGSSEYIYVETKGQLPVNATTFPTAGLYSLCITELGATVTVKQSGVTTRAVDSPAANVLTAIAPRIQTNKKAPVAVTGPQYGQLVAYVPMGTTNCSDIDVLNVFEVNKNGKAVDSLIETNVPQAINTGDMGSPGDHFLVCLGELGATSLQFTLQSDTVSIMVVDPPSNDAITYISPRVFVASNVTLVVRDVIIGQYVGFGDCSTTNYTYVSANNSLTIADTIFTEMADNVPVCLAELGGEVEGVIQEGRTITVAGTPEPGLIQAINPRVQTARNATLGMPGLIEGQHVYFVTGNDCSTVIPSDSVSESYNDELHISDALFPSPTTKNVCVGELGAPAANYTLQGPAIVITAANSPLHDFVSYSTPRVQYNRQTTLDVTGLLVGQYVYIVDSTATNCSDIPDNFEEYIYVTENDKLSISGTSNVENDLQRTPLATFPTAGVENNKYCVGEWAASRDEFSLQTADGTTISAYDTPSANQITFMPPRVGAAVNAKKLASPAYVGQFVHFVPFSASDCNSIDVSKAIRVDEENYIDIPNDLLPLQEPDIRVCLGEYAAYNTEYRIQTSKTLSAYVAPVVGQIDYNTIRSVTPRVLVGAGVEISVAGALVGQLINFIPSSAGGFCPGLDTAESLLVTVNDKVTVKNTTFPSSGYYDICVGELGFYASQYRFMGYQVDAPMIFAANQPGETDVNLVSRRIAVSREANIIASGLYVGQYATFSTDCALVDPASAILVTTENIVTVTATHITTPASELFLCLGELGSTHLTNQTLATLNATDIIPPADQITFLSPRVHVGVGAQLSVTGIFLGQTFVFVPKGQACTSANTSLVIASNFDDQKLLNLNELIFPVAQTYDLCLGELGAPLSDYTKQTQVEITAFGSPAVNQVTYINHRVMRYLHSGSVVLEANGVKAGQLVAFVPSNLKNCDSVSECNAILVTEDNSFTISATDYLKTLEASNLCVGELGADSLHFTQQMSQVITPLLYGPASNQVHVLTPRVGVNSFPVLQAQSLHVGQRVFFTNSSESCGSGGVDTRWALNVTVADQIVLKNVAAFVHVDTESEAESKEFATVGTYYLCVGEVGQQQGDFVVQSSVFPTEVTPINTLTIGVFDSPSKDTISFLSRRVQYDTVVDLVATGAKTGQYAAFVAVEDTDCSNVDVSKATRVNEDGVITTNANSFPNGGNASYKLCLGEYGHTANLYTVQENGHIFVASGSASATQMSAVSPRIYKTASAVTLFATGIYAGQLVNFVPSTALDCSMVVVANSVLTVDNDAIPINAASTVFPDTVTYQICVGELGADRSLYTLQPGLSITSVDKPSTTQVVSASPRIAAYQTANLTVTPVYPGQFVYVTSGSCSNSSPQSVYVAVSNQVTIPSTVFSSNTTNNKLCIGELGLPGNQYVLQTPTFNSYTNKPAWDQVKYISPRVATQAAVSINATGVKVGQLAHFVPFNSTCAENVVPAASLVVTTADHITLNEQTFTAEGSNQYNLCVGELGAPASNYTMYSTIFITAASPNPSAEQVTALSRRVRAGVATTLSVKGIYLGQRVAFLNSALNCTDIDVSKSILITTDGKITIPASVFRSSTFFNRICIGELGANNTRYTWQTLVNINATTEAPQPTQVDPVNASTRVAIKSAATLSAPGIIPGQLVAFVDYNAPDCNSVDISTAVVVNFQHKLTLTDTTFTRQNSYWRMCVGELGAGQNEYTAQHIVVVSSVAVSPARNSVSYLSPRVTNTGGESEVISAVGVVSGQYAAFVSSPESCANVTTSDSVLITKNDQITIPVIPEGAQYLCLGELGGDNLFTAQVDKSNNPRSITAYGVPTSTVVTSISARLAVTFRAVLSAPGIQNGHVVSFVPVKSDAMTSCTDSDATTPLVVMQEGQINITTAYFTKANEYYVCLGELGSEKQYYVMQMNGEAPLKLTVYTVPVPNQITPDLVSAVTPRIHRSASAVTISAVGLAVGQLVGFASIDTDCTVDTSSAIYVSTANQLTFTPSKYFLLFGGVAKYKLCLGEKGSVGTDYIYQTADLSTIEVAPTPTTTELLSVTPSRLVVGGTVSLKLSGTNVGPYQYASLSTTTCDNAEVSSVLDSSSSMTVTLKTATNYTVCLGEYGMDRNSFVSQDLEEVNVVEKPTAAVVSSITPSTFIIGQSLSTIALTGVEPGQLVGLVNVATSVAKPNCTSLTSSNVYEIPESLKVPFNPTSYPASNSTIYVCVGEPGMAPSTFVAQVMKITAIAPVGPTSFAPSFLPNSLMLVISLVFCFIAML